MINNIVPINFMPRTLKNINQKVYSLKNRLGEIDYEQNYYYSLI